MLFNLSVIGEAAKNLPDEAKAFALEADWTGPARMRDLIAHHYFAVDRRIVWEAAGLHALGLLDHARRLRTRFDSDA